MWFGTKEGLNRFDGYHFKFFNLTENKSRNKITADKVYCLFNDKNGTLWVGSDKGLYYYEAKKEQLTRLFDTLPNIYSIQTDSKGLLWFISGDVLYCYNFITENLKQFSPSKYFNATSICKDENETMWFSSDNGFLYKYNEAGDLFESYDMFAFSPSPTSRRIQKIHPGEKGFIYVGTTSQGLKKFDINTNKYADILTSNSDRTSIFVRDILQNSPAEFWFATESGIFILNTQTGKFINLRKNVTDPYSLSDNAVYTLCKDNEGGIWAGTFFGGVNYYSKPNGVFKKYFPDNTAKAIIGNAVREICKDRYGNLWIGTEDAGLCKLDKNGHVTHFKPDGESTGISYYNIHGLLPDGDNLWIGTFEHGIDVMNIKTGKVIKHYSSGPGEKDMKSNFALYFLRSSSGTLYAASSYGFYRFNKTKYKFEREPLLDQNYFFTGIIEDRDKNIWASTNSMGVYWFNPATGKKGSLLNDRNNKNSLTNNEINDVFEDSKNNLWFATEGGGACKLSADRKTITRYTAEDGLPSNFVFKVIEDDDKNIWFSTSRGLVKVHSSSTAFTVYTKENGLLNNQFNYHSGFKDEDGTLYFGSVKGMISFHPDQIEQEPGSPPVFITGLQVYNKELQIGGEDAVLKNAISFTDEITLPYNASSISIDFAALSYESPETMGYSYKLEGLDKDWTNLKTNRKVYFTNLSPKKYVFKVRAYKNNVLSKKERQLIIHILPPFWATAWAYVIYALTLVSIAYFIIKYYHQLHQNKKEKEIYQAKIDFFTNVAHEIKTPLTLIRGPVENLMENTEEMPEIKEDVAMMDRNSRRLMELVSQILDFQQTEVKGYSLYFDKIDITELLKETYENFKTMADKRKLDYQIQFPSKSITNEADEDALRKILSNLFSNAIKYADKKIEVRLYTTTDNIMIEVENDGNIIAEELREKIFQPFYRIGGTRSKGTGIGLTLARSLAELHKGKLYLKETNDANVFIFQLPNNSLKIKVEKQKQKSKPGID